MLFRFSVKNFKNFQDEFVFDLSDTKNFEFNTQCVKNGIVNNALIYGPNGVGKSNLGFAIFDIISNVSDKNRMSEYYMNYLNARCSQDISEFKYEFKFGEDIAFYSYGKKNVDEFIYEIFAINGNVVISYDRRNNNDNKAMIGLNGTSTLNKDISLIKISIIKYIKNNSVLVSDNDNSVFNKFIEFIDNMLYFRTLDDKIYQGYEFGGHDIFEDIVIGSRLNDFELFLNSAQIDCKLGVIEINGKKRVVFDFGTRTIDFWENCSTGTRSLSIFYFWLLKISIKKNKPSFIFIDEFDAYFHQEVSNIVVKKLIGLDFQTILTTHNTSLMNNDLLRPDCYFVMSGNKISSFSSLTEKDIRKAHNIEKMYRAGAFNE
jgi:hypothetical protein